MGTALKEILKQPDIHYLLLLLAEVGFVEGGMLAPSSWGAALLVVAILIPTYVVCRIIWRLWEYSRLSHPPRANARCNQWAFCLTVPVLVALAVGIPCHDNFKSFIEEATGRAPNAYVYYWVSPTGIERTNEHSLLVEFRVGKTDTVGIDLMIHTGNPYKPEYLGSWFYVPKTVYRYQSNVHEVGPGHQDAPVATIDPPLYSYSNYRASIQPNESLYLYFEAGAPLTVRSVTLNGKAITPMELTEETS